MKSEDITGGLDLLGDWLDAKGYTEEAGLCTKAMDEINALRGALKNWDALIRHQYTGSREAMSDMTDCAQETAKLLFGEAK